MNAMAPKWAWRGVHGALVGTLWQTVWDLLEPCVALDAGRYDETSLRSALQCGDMQLWFAGPENGGEVTPALAITTEIRVYPCQKWLNIKYVAGKGLPFAFDFLGTIEDWGRAQGCVGCEGYGRPEWSRLLQRSGYHERGLGYSKRFQDA